MPLTDTSTIILVIALVVVAALLVWLSLSMAAAESAVGARHTGQRLNNKILEVQTDTETSQFIRMKKIGKIHTVQRLIANRYATVRQLRVLPHHMQRVRRRAGGVRGVAA